MKTPDAARTVLVLLPGLLCDAAAWTGPRDALAGVALCHVPDYGLLDSIEAMAAHVLATAPAPRFALAGHSMGGRVALEVLRQAPQRVDRLALLDTGFHPLADGAAGDAERARRHVLLAIARADGMRAMGRQWARGMVHWNQLETPVFEDILDMIERSDVERFEAQVHALLNRPDATPLVPRIACPTLLVCGRDDGWSPLSRHEEMHAAIADSRLVVIEQSGHMTTMERPLAVAEALAAWLAA